MNELKDITALILESIKDKLPSPSIFNIWFENLELVSLTEETATFKTPTQLRKQILETKYKSLITSSLTEVLGFELNIEIIFPENTAANFQAVEVEEYNPPTVLPKDSDKKKEIINSFLNKGNVPNNKNLLRDYTFDNFIEGESNKFAKAACYAVAKEPTYYNPLFIYGHSGLGKTHLLYAVINYISENHPNLNIVYRKSEDFINELIEAIANTETAAFKEKYRTADVLLIDDIQFIAGKESTQEEFFHTFNALYEEGKQIILTSDRPPKDIQTLEDRLKSRFEWGLIADILPPDLELRIAIFKNKISQAGITVSDEIITYLAENLRSHIRQIEGAVKKLVAIKFLEGNEITLDRAKSIMTELLGGAEPTSVTVDKIFSAIEKKYDVSKQELIGNSRVKNVAQARHVAIYLVKTITDISYPSIGKLFNRNHSTIMSSVEVIDKKISSSPAMEIEVNELIKEIKE